MGIRDYSNEVKVGLMVGASIFIFVVAVLSLGGGSTLFRSQYELQVKLPSTEGLGPGSVVQLIGVPVGNVEEVVIIPTENKLLVKMNIDRKFKPLITEGSSAGLKTQGALGDKFVLIEPGPSGKKPLKDGDLLITREGGDILSALTEGGDKFEKIFSILEGVDTFVKNLNANGRSAVLMENLAASSTELKTLLSNTNVIVEQIKTQKKLEKSLTHLANVLEKVDNGKGTLGALINDPSLHDSLKSVLGGSSRSNYVKGVIRKSIKTGKD